MELLGLAHNNFQIISSKSHKAIEEKHLTPLELIHYDICEMNSVLTDGEQRYFITMIDDVS
jgi:hypothetical protein